MSEDFPQIPTIIADRYRVIQVIGKGGMGVVVEAEQIGLERTVAIKLLQSPDQSRSSKRFLLEARTLARLSHPNTVRIFDSGRDTNSGLLYLAMEFVNGKTLKALVLERRQLAPELAIYLTLQICSALAEAHRYGIIHRDIKPVNILVTETPELHIKLLDFGLVKLLNADQGISKTGAILGSPMYMTPEQIQSSEIDERTDVYSLGLTLMFMLTGQNPYDRCELGTLLQKQLSEPPRSLSRLSQHPQLLKCVRKSINKEPEHRFQNMESFQDALKSLTFQHNEDSKLTSPQDAESTRKNNSLLGTSLMISVLAVLVSIWLGVRHIQRSASNLLLESTPSASVFQAGKVIGTTPLKLQLQPKEQLTVQLQLPGYEPQRVTLSQEERKRHITLKPLN